MQNSFISVPVPGSCSPNWLQGKPMIVKFLSEYFKNNSSSSLNCGVNPHLLAVLTISIFLPFKVEKSSVSPSIVFFFYWWIEDVGFPFLVKNEKIKNAKMAILTITAILLIYIGVLT